MNKLQKYLSQPISVYVLQYSIVNPGELSDGSEEFKWVIGYHGNLSTYNKLAGLGKLKNMRMMDRMSGSSWVEGSTVVAATRGSCDEETFEYIATIYKDHDDLYWKIDHDGFTAAVTKIVTKGYVGVVRQLLLAKYVEASYVLPVDLNAEKNGYMITAMIYNEFSKSECLDAILMRYCIHTPFNIDVFVRLFDTWTENLNIALAERMFKRGKVMSYWIHNYQLFSKIPRAMLTEWCRKSSIDDRRNNNIIDCLIKMYRIKTN